jgi:hypothetical protein
MVLRLNLSTDNTMIRMRIVDIKIMNNDIELAKRNNQRNQEGYGTIPYIKAWMDHAAILHTIQGCGSTGSQARPVISGDTGSGCANPCG